LVFIALCHCIIADPCRASLLNCRCKFARFMGRNLPISWATRHGIATPKRPNLPRNERNSSHEASKFTIDHDYVSWSSPYQVLHVSDGFAALKMVRTLISQLILLDYLLPDMDGLECLDRL